MFKPINGEDPENFWEQQERTYKSRVTITVRSAEITKPSEESSKRMAEYFSNDPHAGEGSAKCKNEKCKNWMPVSMLKDGLCPNHAEHETRYYHEK
jgi:hypothetical protein